MNRNPDITRLLRRYSEGDEEAFDRLVPLVYDELRRIARGHLRRGPAGRTLGVTGVVHEAYLKLASQAGADWKNRSHFLAVAARAMRQVIISYARRGAALKRGGEMQPVTLEEERIALEQQSESLLDLDRVLARLATRDERLVHTVECRYFAGFSEEETAEALGMSLRTVQRNWARARAWLREELSSTGAEGAGG